MDTFVYDKEDYVRDMNTTVNRPGNTIVLAKETCENNVLTAAEIRVLHLTANGLSEKEIADHLCISIHTVKSHRKNMIRKTGAKNCAALVKYGMANLLIS